MSVSVYKRKNKDYTSVWLKIYETGKTKYKNTGLRFRNDDTRGEKIAMKNANILAVEIQNAINHGKFDFKKNEKRLFVDVANEYINNKTNEKTKQTYKERLILLGKVFELTTELSEFSFSLLDEICTEIEKKDLYLNTKKALYMFLKSVLSYSFRKEFINIFPFPKPKFTGDIRDVDFLSPNELDDLINKFQNVPLPPHQWEVLRAFLFGCFCALRKSDLFSLKYNQIYFNEKCYYLKKKTIKTGAIVNIPLAEKSLQFIDVSRIGTSEQVFDLRLRSGDNSALNEICKKLNIKHLHFHMSRHTTATLLARNTTNIVLISSMLGHTNTNTTQRYLDMVSNDLEIAVNKI